MRIYETNEALALAVRRNPGTVSRWRRRPDWPVRRDPPWSGADVETVKRWAVEMRRNRDGGARPWSDGELAEADTIFREAGWGSLEDVARECVGFAGPTTPAPRAGAKLPNGQ